MGTSKTNHLFRLKFLFRNKDIHSFKSTTAAEAAKAMNPDLNITSYQEKVAMDTELLFGDDFYDKLSGVCTALDNVEARLYVDRRCLFYRLPMLESGIWERRETLKLWCRT
jgi:ubiquitin-activating enzyme E1